MFDELKTEEGQEPKEQRATDYSGVIIGAITLPVLMLFHYLGKFDMGLSVTVCLGMNLLSIRLRWELKRCVWFWTVAVLAFALEVPLALMIQWHQITINRITLLPIGIAALLITLGSVKFAEKFIVKYVPPDKEV